MSSNIEYLLDTISEKDAEIQELKDELKNLNKEFDLLESAFNIYVNQVELSNKNELKIMRNSYRILKILGKLINLDYFYVHTLWEREVHLQGYKKYERIINPILTNYKFEKSNLTNDNIEYCRNIGNVRIKIALL